MKKIPPVKYMRDFYPHEMAVRNRIEEAWRRASVRAGFREWDSPILEELELYKRKSGDEIVGQLYTLTTQGGKELAIRPEMTPSLARMVAQRQASLPRPIKWFCISRMCRYERGQRGRLREFWQWNVDVLDVPGPQADAEVISVGLDALEDLGLTSDEIEVRINSRTLMVDVLTALEIPPEVQPGVFAVTDKRGKIDDDKLQQMYADLELTPKALSALLELMSCETLDDVASFCETKGLGGYEESLAQVAQLFEYAEALGKGPYCRFDVGIVRGLAYYTGPVFEIFDKVAQLRALCGGGRYDNLMQTMGGQPMSAVGFGLGDVVLSELLAEQNKLPTDSGGVDAHLIALEQERFPDAMRLVDQLRRAGLRADFAMKTGGVGKALKRADDAGARVAVLVGGEEWLHGKVRVRSMSDRSEDEVATSDLVERLKP